MASQTLLVPQGREATTSKALGSFTDSIRSTPVEILNEVAKAQAVMPPTEFVIASKARVPVLFVIVSTPSDIDHVDGRSVPINTVFGASGDAKVKDPVIAMLVLYGFTALV